MKTVEERLRSYEPLWENWTYTGNFLGEGAMSSVFEIQSTAMGMRELAALKIITVKKNMLGEMEIPENALNEIKILRDLSGCPNIVNYHDSTQRKIFDSDNSVKELDILIKMEKLRALNEDEKLSEEQIIKLGRDICNALVHASEHNVIHRDIKPQNIFVDDEGTYKLGDFGIAKIVSGLTSHYTMNIGTLAYTAPEVQGGVAGVYDISSDIYSFGLVLYVFLNNGLLPFVGGGASLHNAIAKRLAGDPFPSPARGSKHLKSIVMRACNSDVNKRYKTPQEMLNDFELLSTGGRKMVIDPFATLDANIDVADLEPTVVGSGMFTLSDEGKKASRIKSKLSTDSPKPVVSETPVKRPASEEKITGSRLKINMGKRTEEKPKEVVEPAVKDTGSTGSRLKINMGTRTSEKTNVEVKPIKKIDASDSDKTVVSPKESNADKPEKKGTSHFSTPDSI